MTKRQIMGKIPFKLLVIFLLLAAGILAGGYFYYKDQTAKTVEHIKNDLQTIAEYKVNQIYDWRRERFGNAFVITSSEMFTSSVRRWLKDPADKYLYNYINRRLDAFRIYETYKDAILVDPAGNIKFFIDKGTTEKISPLTMSIVKQAVKNKAVMFTDFYYCDQCREVHLDVVAPLFDRNGLAATVILRIDPNKFLYPLIQSWPLTSRTGETVLVRREGDEVVFLNELRHHKDAALKFRLPISDTLLPATMAALGKEGLVEGLDYRDVPVLASLGHIKDSPWYMVVKIDKDEIYAPLYRQERNIAISIILMLMAAGLSIGFFWQTERRGFYKKQYQQELDRQALVRHFDYLTKYANDIILLSDNKYRIVEANEKAVQIYGYSRDELVSMLAMELRPENLQDSFKKQMDEIISKDGRVFETKHRRKDGSTFPVEVSARPIEVEGKKYLQSIVRDISERKQYELDLQERNEELEAANQELLASEEELKAADEELRHNMEELSISQTRFAELFKGINNGVAVYQAVDDGADFVFLDFNPAGQRIEQKTKDQVIGKRVSEVFPGVKKMGLFEVFQRVWRTGQPENHPVSFYRDQHLTGWRENYVYRLPTGEVVSIYEDLTEQKNAEQALVENEKLLRAMADNYPNSYISIVNNDLTVGFTSGQEFKKNGLDPSSFVGMTLEQVFGERADNVKEHYLETFAGKETSFELFINNQYQSYRTVPLYDENKKINKILAVVENITDRKRAEEALLQSEERLRSFIDNTFIGIYRTTPDGRILMSNPALVSMLGYASLEDLVRRNLEQENYTPGYERAVFKRLVEQGDQLIGYESLWKRKDGSEVWMRENARCIRGPDREVLFYEGTVEDITERKQAEKKIISSETRYRRLFESAKDGILILNADTGVIDDANPFIKDLLGYPREELMGKELWEIGLFGDIVASRASFMELKKKGYVRYENLPLESKDGWKKDVEFVSNVYPVGDHNVVQCNIRDITERKQAEATIAASETRYRRLFESAQESILILNAETGDIESANPYIKNMLGYSSDEIVGKQLWEIGLFKDIAASKEDFIVLKNSVHVRHEGLPLQTKEGREIKVEFISNVYPVGDHNVVQCNIRDITQRLKNEEKIKAALKEKEVMLKEIHHRVKNNLQIIASLLNLQTGYVKDPHYKKMFLESQNRVRSMALVHEKLYHSKDLAGIDFPEYVGSLMNDLYSTYGTTQEEIKLSTNILVEKLSIGIAIPCGLIINELVSNSFKYAFKDINDKGRIDISLTKDDAGIFTLEVSDNGPGISADLDLKNAPTLGLQLVDALVGQLDASIRITGENGTKVTIKFKAQPVGLAQDKS